eukprot:6186037-Pleurochrysis_carterae.AAC.2
MPVHCCHKPDSSEHVRLAGTISRGTAIKSNVIWKAGQESLRFRIDVVSAVEFVNALPYSAVGKCIIHYVAVSLTLAVLMYRLLCDAHADTSLMLSRIELAAECIVLASLHYSQRVTNPLDTAVKRLGALSTLKGEAKGAVGAGADGLVVQFRNFQINQR